MDFCFNDEPIPVCFVIANEGMQMASIWSKLKPFQTEYNALHECRGFRDIRAHFMRILGWWSTCSMMANLDFQGCSDLEILTLSEAIVCKFSTDKCLVCKAS